MTRALLLLISALVAAPAKPAELRQLSLTRTAWTGDFDGMLERRIVRVLVPFSRSLYYADRGQERGLAADNVRAFERWLNERHAKALQNRPLTVLLIPTTRDRLLQEVAEGLGDLAVGNLTITPERERLVDFVSAPDLPPVRELVVSASGSPPVPTPEALAGRTVHVRPSSSYRASLEALNARLRTAGQPPARLVPVPDALEDEDLLEMINAGILEAVVVDDWKARMWAPVLPRVRVEEGAVLRADGRLGWAVRKQSPGLVAEVQAYQRQQLGRGVITGRVKQYARNARRTKDPTRSAEWKRFQQMLALFQKYGLRYHFDPLLVAAQGYQESRLDQGARSQVGAVGVMQVMPATGAELRVGDIRQLEPNIHAGAKYMDQLMTRYFGDEPFDELNRTLFAFASYNCGPGNVARMRAAAAKQGLDPNLWFDNVEIVTAQKIGMETTTYVRNIYKYYVAYKLALEARAAADAARGQVAAPAPPPGGP